MNKNAFEEEMLSQCSFKPELKSRRFEKRRRSMEEFY
jgi:hypothetical protein